MLTRVEITKFKSCENLVFDGLGRITALVGRNGAGKTNILQAIDWMARASTLARPVEIDPALGLTDITAHLALPDGRYAYRIEATNLLGGSFTIRESLDWEHTNGRSERAFSRNGESVVIGGSQTIQVGATAATMPALLAVLPVGAPILDQIRPVHSFFSGIRYYPLDERARSAGGSYASQAEYEQWLTGHSANARSDDSVAYRFIQMHLEEEGLLEEIKLLLGGSGLGLVDDIIVTRLPLALDAGSMKVFYVVAFTVGSQPTEFGWDELSLGTRRIVRLLVSLVCDHSSVMLVEHPEDGIHRGLLRKLIGLLKSYADPTQVILASHSGVVLNSLEPEETRLVSIESGKTALRSLSEQELELATHFLEEEGTLDDFLETIQED